MCLYSYTLARRPVLRRKDKNPDSTDNTLLEEPSLHYYLRAMIIKIMIDRADVSPTASDGCRIGEKKEDPGGMPQAIGVSPGEIDIVINTHLHWDHAGNNNIFKKQGSMCRRGNMITCRRLRRERRAYDGAERSIRS